MRIVYMGTPDFAVPSLKALVEAGHEVCGVFSQPDKPVGRHQNKLQPTPVKVCAQAYGIPVFQPETLRDGTALAQLQELAPDLIVVAAYGRVLPWEILELPAYGCINVHSSLLPKYRGAAPINWAMVNGDKETGVPSPLPTTVWPRHSRMPGTPPRKLRSSTAWKPTLSTMWTTVWRSTAMCISPSGRKSSALISRRPA